MFEHTRRINENDSSDVARSSRETLLDLSVESRGDESWRASRTIVSNQISRVAGARTDQPFFREEILHSGVSPTQTTSGERAAFSR